MFASDAVDSSRGNHRLFHQVFLILCLLGAAAWQTQAATFTVDRADDAGGTTCTAAANDCSFRGAIDNANANGPGADTIIFNIPGSGVKSINLIAGLPVIKTSLTIDGTTQSGYFGKPMVEISGLGVNSYGLSIDSPAPFADIAVTIIALALNRHVYGVYSTCFKRCDITLLGNFIGTDPSGTIALPNGEGVYIAPSGNITVGGEALFEGNLISGNGIVGSSNSNAGVDISPVAFDSNYHGAFQVKILGNRIGTDFDGNIDLGNADQGIKVSEFTNQGFAVSTLTLTIGGSNALARNIISGNDENGIVARCSNVTITGNYIGTNAAGTAALGNGALSNFFSDYGIYLIARDGGNYQIGGDVAGEGNVVSGNKHGAGIYVFTGSGGSGTAQLSILGNYIGTNSNGTADLGNYSDGISIDNLTNYTVNATIGGVTAGARNIISGNGSDGIRAGSGNISIYRNYIGTDKDGVTDLGNTGAGVRVVYDANVNIGGTVIQNGTPYDAGNLISGNQGDGIVVATFATAPVVIRRNRIGTNAAGTSAIPNGGNGVKIGNGGAVIGSDVNAADGNLISGNGEDGIHLEGENGSAHTARIYGNKIGTNSIAGDFLANGQNGIEINNSSNNQIGLAGSGTATNFISGNTLNGIYLVGSATGNKIENNVIGAGSIGNDLGNQGSGVQVEASQNFVGKPSGTGNTIAFNQKGVWVKFGTNNEIRGNSIYANDGLGIDLDTAGVTPNDPGDADGGANTKQNFPLLTAASPNSIAGSLNSTAGTSFAIDFYRVDSCHSSGHGEGRYYLGSKAVVTDGTGNVQFYSPPVFLSIGQVVTATATVSGNGANDTSEFSQCLAVMAIPSISFSASSYSVNEGVATRTIVVNRTGGSNTTVSVDYATANGTATAGQDYTATNGTLTFNSGEVTKSFDVAISNDSLDEADETINITLSNAQGALLTDPSTAGLTIIDNDVAPSLSITDVTANEGNSGTTIFTFHINLSAPSGLSVSANYGTADGAATTPSDYLTASGPVNFAAGETDKTVAISVNSDTTAEPDENFFVNLSNPTNANIADNQGVGMIINDDQAFIIRGEVRRPDNSPLANAMLTLTGSQSTTSTTDPNGRYVFMNLAPNGNYTVTAVTNGYTCAPSSRSYLALANDVTNADFAATPTGPTAAPAYVRGQITTTDGQPLSGVTLAITGGSTALGKAITNQQGRYEFANVETNGFYTLTAERANYSFTPAVQAFSLLGNRTDANFNALPLAVVNANPLETPEFFVRQQYLDFLGREPDQAGLDYWSNQLHACESDARCLSTRRPGVSAAFFVEQEFQQTGSFVYRLYKVSYGRRPMYAEFQPDRGKVVGGAELAASKQAFIDLWIQRDEFRQVYPDSLTNEQFVTTLMTTAQLAELQEATHGFVDQLNAGAARATILGQVIDLAAFRSKEYDSSFVLMQYFGYLRRDPDQGGYDFWLNVLHNLPPGSSHGMVCAFITAAEYQDRFSPVRTRNDGECVP